MIDSHAHLTVPQVLPDVEIIIQRAKEAKVTKIINICIDKFSLEEGLKIEKKHSGIFTVAATTPHDVDQEGESFFPFVERLAKEKKLVGIGETGLDYFYLHSSKEMQQKFLIRYLDLAKKVDLPVIFHCRDAFSDLFSIADEVYHDLPAVLHCFTGTKEECKKGLDRGWMISFSGIVTFKKSEDLREIVHYVPLDRMFIETDTPYLAPLSKRGKQNEPSFLFEIAEKIAEVKKLSFEEIESATEKNCKQFFALK